MRYGTSFLASIILCIGSNATAKNFGPPLQIGNWQGSAYTDDATGAFSHCAAGTPYTSGIYFLVSIDAHGGWSLGFVHKSWQLQKGTTIPIDLTFDNRRQFHVFGTVLDSNFVVVPMPTDSDLINQFRRAYTMSAFAQGQLFPFNLNTTSQLLPALANCVTANIRGKTASTGTSPNVSSLRPMESSPPNLQIEAIQLATNFILKSGLHNPKVLSPPETPTEYVSFGAAWKSDEASGAVKIVAPDPNLKGIDVAAAIAGADAKECKGKFASGRVSELIDSEVVFRGFSSCEDTEGARSAQFFVIPRSSGGFVIFSIASTQQGQGQSPKTIEGDELVGFQKAALSASQ